jgi:hypothetical protein
MSSAGRARPGRSGLLAYHHTPTAHGDICSRGSAARTSPDDRVGPPVAIEPERRKHGARSERHPEDLGLTRPARGGRVAARLKQLDGLRNVVGSEASHESLEASCSSLVDGGRTSISVSWSATMSAIASHSARPSGRSL